MRAIVYKDANPYIVSKPWVLELHNGGCDCGCEAVEGKVGKLIQQRIQVDSYRTKKQAQFEADTMNAIDRGDPQPPISKQGPPQMSLYRIPASTECLCKGITSCVFGYDHY